MRKKSTQALMKVFTFALILFTTTIHAQNYAWTSTIGGVSTDRIHAIDTDADGNVYVCGSFKSTVDFDPGVNETNITSAGNYDAFVQKLNADGELIWIKTFGGSQKDAAVDMQLDANGNIYITGYFSKTVDFDPGTGVANSITNGATDIFLQKLDTDGNFEWVKTWGGSSTDEGAALAIDNTGNVYFTGFFKKTVDFDHGAGVSELTANGSFKNIFIQKIDNNGDFIWCKGMIGATAKPVAITVDNDGNVHSTGYFSGTVDFNPGSSVENKTSRGQNDIYVQKLDTNGDFIWTSTIEGTSDNQASSLAVADNGNVFVTGMFNGIADFDPSANAMDLPTNGSTDGFLQKLNANGELLFVKKLGGSFGDEANDVIIDLDNNVWVTGYFHTSMTLNAQHGPLQSVAGEDVYVAKYNQDGAILSTITFGGASNDHGSLISFNGVDLFTAGTFTGNDVDFDISIATDKKSSVGLEDIFVQKLTYCIAADVPAVSVSALQVCEGESVTFEIISGELNSAANWFWRKGSCTGDYVGEGTSVTDAPTETTTYYVSGEGGCITNSTCQTVTVTILGAPKTSTEEVSLCKGENFTAPDGTEYTNILEPISHSSVFSTSYGCDSTIITNITLKDTYNVEESAQVCVGENYTFADGTTVENITEGLSHTSNLTTMSGCDSTITEVVSPVIIQADISINGNTLGTSVIDADYQWIDCDTDMEIQGATESTFSPSTSGNYAVVVTKNGCSSISPCESMTIVGTLAPAREKHHVVYPNPMITTLNVSIGSSYKEGSIALYHITGKRVHAQKLNGERQVEINVNDMIQGAYYLQIITDGIPAITKVVK